MKKTKLLQASFISISILLSGCATIKEKAKDYKPYKKSEAITKLPEVNLPSKFPHVTSGQYYTNINWYNNFKDAKLSSLVQRVLAKNNDLALAGLKMQRARLSANLVKLQNGPQYTTSVSASDDVNLKNSNNSQNYSASVGVSYDLDLWGKVKAAKDSAGWEIDATQQDKEATRLSIIGDVCNYYWQIAYLNEEINSTNSSIDYAKKLLNLVKVQHKAGAVSGISVLEAEQSLQTEVAKLASLQQQIVENKSAVSILLDGEAFPNSLEPKSLPAINYSPIAAGIPLSTIKGRPDVRASELRLLEDIATVEQNRISLYPSISLTGQGSSSSSDLLKILNNPIAALGVGVNLPFLQKHQLQLKTDISQNDYEQAVVSYRKTLLNALFEIDNALSNGQKLSLQNSAQNQNLIAAQKSARLYYLRYQAGAEALRVYLDAEEKVRAAKLSYDNVRLSQLLNRVTLYQAIGG